jgi:predicted site-specific integrase-resolvase
MSDRSDRSDSAVPTRYGDGVGAREIAELFGVTRPTVHKWIRGGLFCNVRKAGPYTRSAYRVPLQEVYRVYNQGKVA